MFDRALSLLAPPACHGCGREGAAARPLCAECQSRLRWLGVEPVALSDDLVAWAPLAYEGAARDVVRALKFRGALRLAGPMAAAIAANAPPGALSGGTLVPVPLHGARRRRRGFNQAEELARALEARTGTPVVDCLRRSAARGHQVGRGRAERLAALEHAIELRIGATAPVAPVLVDDVLTTGATLRACAAALLARGSGPVRAVTYARTLGR